MSRFTSDRIRDARLRVSPSSRSSTRVRQIAHARSLFAGSISTRANLAGAVRPGPRHVWWTRLSTSNGDVAPTTILRKTRGTPTGRRADAEAVVDANAGPLSGLSLSGCAACGRHDAGRSVTVPAGSTPSPEHGACSCGVGPHIEHSTRRNRYGGRCSTRTAASSITPEDRNRQTARPIAQPSGARLVVE